MLLEDLIGKGREDRFRLPVELFIDRFPIGISFPPGALLGMAELPSRNMGFVEGDSLGARCDLRFCRSIILTAQASRSTGVRLAACKNSSDS